MAHTTVIKEEKDFKLCRIEERDEYQRPLRTFYTIMTKTGQKIGNQFKNEEEATALLERVIADAD